MRYYEIINELDAFHGTPHKFGAFNMDHLGKGQGRQAWGYGIYFTNKKHVADYYRKILSTFTYDGKIVKKNQERLRSAIYQLIEAHGDKYAAAYADKSVADLIYKLDYHKIGTKGFIYSVTLPDDEKYLDFDKPFKQQSSFVKSALIKLAPKYGQHIKECIKDNDVGEMLYRHMGNYNRNVKKISFDDTDKQTSLDLYSVGIVGNRYYTTSDHSQNYVLFSENDIKIKTRE